jgi:lipopolysaccharide/colanic/teichoic acid biosynthesis glycosyltransferase
MSSVVQQRAISPSVARVFAEAAPTAESLPKLTVLPAEPESWEAEERARRILNVTIAAVALIVTMPIMFLVALVVMLTSRGPILYTQPRVGVNRRRTGSSDGRRRIDYGGRLFKIYKFRTMYVGADRHGESWARPDDPRVTPVGKVLRKFRLDELPQLYNVLCGDMNVVGPRPEQPKIFTHLRHQIENYGDRQRVLPGITGLAQVSQHYDNSVDDVRRKLMFDLQYIDRRSVGQDLKVLLQTLPVVIFQKGAW